MKKAVIIIIAAVLIVSAVWIILSVYPKGSTQSQAPANTQADTKPNTQADTNTNIQPDSQVATKPEAKTGTQAFGKQDAIKLYKDKFFKDMPTQQFPSNAAYEEIMNNLSDGDAQNPRIRVCYIVPDGFVSEKSGEYEVGGYVLNVNSYSTPSVTGIYVIVDDKAIYTLDDALYNQKFPLAMWSIYEKLPQRYKELKYITPTDAQRKELENTARGLLERNFETFSRIFVLSMLPADTPDGGVLITPEKEAIYPVKSDKFKAMADLENFIRNTYIKRTADTLLYNTHGDGPAYLEKDGKLCVDLKKEVGVGYYRNWSNLQVKIAEFTGTSASIIATVSEFGPDDEKEHPVDVTFKVIKENGNWLLCEMKA